MQQSKSKVFRCTMSDAKASQNKDSIKDQSSTSSCSSTPNDHEMSKTSNDTLDMTRRDLQRIKEVKESQSISRNNIMNTYRPTDYKNRTTEEFDDQQTLLTLLGSDRKHLGQDKETNDISLHGPSDRGPRVLLTNHQEG